MCLALVVLGLVLRLHDSDVRPPRNQPADEYAWSWAGISLLEKGAPTSWSWLQGYPTEKRIEMRGNPYRMVTPWFDHPPVFALVMGAWLRLHGCVTAELDVDLRLMRRVPIALSAVTMLLLAWLVASRSGLLAAGLALALYATAPPAVVGDRVVVAEALFVPVGLLALLAQFKMEEPDGKRRWGAVHFAAAALLPGIKLAACSISLFLVLHALARGQKRTAFAAIAASIVGLLGVVAYGVALNKDIAWAVLTAQGGRFSGFNGLFELLFVSKSMAQGPPWMPLLIGNALALRVTTHQHRGEWLGLGSVYALCMTFLVNQNEVYPWYAAPMHVMACAVVAVDVAQVWRTPNPMATVLVGAVATATTVSSVAHLSGGGAHNSLLRWVYAGILLGSVGFLLVISAKRTVLLQRAILGAACVSVFVVGTVRSWAP